MLVSSISRFVGRWAAPLTLLLSVGALNCTTQNIPTASRTLDRPSDVALYCVELEIPNCLPQMDPDADPAAYIAAYCDQTRIDDANNAQPISTVLAESECDDDHRRVRLDNYLAPVHRAAQATGRDANAPCCAPDDTLCTTLTPACTRRVLGALITNTSRGELAVADTQAQDTGLSTIGRLENLHSGQPGYGFLPTGLLPEHVRSFSPPGPTGSYGRKESPAAWAVTANAGSCDLSLISIDKVVKLAERPAICYQADHQADAQCSTRTCDSDSCPQRIEPWLPGAGNARRPLNSRPSWLEVAPWSDGSRRVVMVAYPTCGLIATVDLGPVGAAGCDPNAGCGRISDAVAFDATGKPRVLSAAALAALECAADCGGDSSPSLMPDPKNLPDGGVAGIPVFPATLAVESAGQRVLIGDAVGKSITVVDFDGSAADGSRFIGTPRTIPLDFSVLPESLRGGQPGLDAIRISPRTPAGQFAYIVARDSSVRVIDMDREIECETNPDPRYLRAHAGDFARVLPDELNDSNLRRLSCFPVGATPRAPLAISSGISLSTSSLPRDVGFVHVDAQPCDRTDPFNCPLAPDAQSTIWLPAKSSLWLGDFAWIMGGGGVATGIQMADSCPAPSYRACFPDAAALRRVAFLHTRSQYLPSPDLLSLPGFIQAQMVSPTDRLMNVKRLNSRFDEQIAQFGPRTNTDNSGVPTFVTSVLGTAVSYFESVSDPSVTLERRRLLLPTPAPYYYLPVDPVCDLAIASHAKPEGFAKPDGILPPEPMRRPMSMVQFTDASALTDSIWTLDWEGVLGGLTRTSGRLLGDGTLMDLNGLYCSRGVESGDKVWLTGCQSDTDCFNGSTCHREAAQGFDPGICLTNDQANLCRSLSQQLVVDTSNDTVWAASWLRRYRVSRAEQQVTIGSGDVADRLILDEIPEPEYEIERPSCTTLGETCSGTILLPGRSSSVDVSKPSPKLTCRGVGNGGGTLAKSCVLECQSNVNCGVGFVCAHSRYEEDEAKAGLSDAGSRPRCVRAPLIHPRTPMRKGGSWQPMGIDAANALLAACYPDLSNYEVHSGDSFLVHGDRTGAPSLVQRAADGSCQRPPVGTPSYNVSRLMEPRLRLGPHDAPADLDPQRCPSGGPDWLSHRVPAIPEAVAQPSCQALRPPSKGGVRSVKLQGTMEGTLDLVRGEDFPLPTTSATDPWLASEFELFSGLPLDGGRNQCILTNAADERYPTSNETNGCSGFCRFPGDHTELSGVRRIHFENPLGNLVMRVPRVLRDFSRPYSDCHDLSRGAPTAATCACKAFDPVTKLCPEDSIQSWNEAVWSVPPDGYSISFVVTGTLTTYAVPVQTASRDISSGTLAQSLKSVTAGPSGSLYLVDEGRTGQASGLRGQVMRIIGSNMDISFLLR